LVPRSHFSHRRDTAACAGWPTGPSSVWLGSRRCLSLRTAARLAYLILETLGRLPQRLGVFHEAVSVDPGLPARDSGSRFFRIPQLHHLKRRNRSEASKVIDDIELCVHVTDRRAVLTLRCFRRWESSRRW